MCNQRRTSVESFVWGVIEANKKGWCREDLAVKLGMKPASIYQRTYELRRQGVKIPCLPARQAIEKASVAERANRVLREARRKGDL
jgi:hypothetical protein